MPVKFDGSIRLARQIVFNGQTYNASDNVVSHLNLKMIDGEVQFDLLRPDLYAANVNLGILLKVKYVDGSVELRSQAATQKKDFKAPLPMIGLGTGVAMLKNLLRADARATGIAYAGNHLYEGDAFLTFSPIPFFAVQGGYRLIDLKIDDDDILATLKLKGPYVGAQLSF
jgi:hypothetical protein